MNSVAYVSSGLESGFRIFFVPVMDYRCIGPFEAVSFLKPHKMLSYIDSELGCIKTIAQRIIPNLTWSEDRCD